MIKINNTKGIDILVLLILMNGFKMIILSKVSSELFIFIFLKWFVAI